MDRILAITGHFPYIGIFVLLILGGIGFPFPEDATLILCGFLISHKAVQLIPALFVVYSGLLIADVFLYFIGRKYGRMIVAHKRFHRIISPEKLSTLEDKFNKKGVFLILIGRHMFGLRAQIFLVAGVMKMSFLRFLTADAVSSIFTMALMIGLGYIGGNSLQVIRRDITRIEHIAIFFIIILIAVYVLFKFFKAREDKNSL